MSFYDEDTQTAVVATDTTDLERIMDVTRVAAGITPVEIHPGKIYLTTDSDGDHEVIDTDKYLGLPRNYWTCDRSVDQVGDFLGYIDAHNEDGTAEIWAHLTPERTGIQVLAFLDANTHQKQKVTLRFERTRRWTDWLKIDRGFYGQGEFAEFLEDHTEDLLDPDAATMLEVAQSLRATVNTKVEQGLRLDNGQVQMVYKEDLEGKAGKAGTLTIPTDISIQVQPYTTSSVFKIDAKFRYRLQQGELRVGIKLMNADIVIEQLFTTIIAELQAANVAPVYLGKPAA